MSRHVISPSRVEAWPLGSHTGVTSKLLVDGANITVLWSRWAPNAVAPEHVHPHEQIGVCLEGCVVLVIDGEEHQVDAGDFYHIPSNTRHAERNDGPGDAILVDFFSPVRSDLLQRRFDAQVIPGQASGEGQQRGKGGCDS